MRLVTALRRLGRHSVLYGLGQAAGPFVGLLLVPLFTRYLTPRDYGLLAAAEVVGAILSTTYMLGFGVALGRLFFEYDAAGRRRLVGTCWLFLMATTAVVSVALTVVGDAVFGRIYAQVPFRPFLLLVVWTAFCNATVQFYLVTLQMHEEAPRYVTLSTVQLVFNLLLSVLFVVVLERGALGRLEALALIAAVAFLWSTVALQRLADLRWDWQIVSEALRLGLPILPSNLAHWALTTSGIVFLERYVSLVDTGLYQVASRIAWSVNIVVVALGTAWLPIFYRDAGHADAAFVIGRLYTYFALGLGAIGLVVAVYSPEIIAILTAPAFHASAGVIPLLLVAAIARGVYALTNHGIAYARRTYLYTVIAFSAAALQIGLNFLLVPGYGMYGAVASAIASFAVLLGLTHYFCQRLFPVRWEYGRLARFLLTAAVCYVAASAVPTASLWLSVPLKALILAAGAAFLLSSGLFSPAEMAGARRLLRELTRRGRARVAKWREP